MAHQQQESQDQKSDVRIRTLSEKGEGQYQERKDTLFKNVESSFKILLQCLGDFDMEHFPKSIHQLNCSEANLHASYDRYQNACNAYFDYLTRMRTSTSERRARIVLGEVYRRKDFSYDNIHSN